MSTMKCSIVSAEQEIFAGDVQMLSVTGAEGELGITPGHSQLLTSIKPGPVKLTLEDGTEEVFFASGGFVEVQLILQSVQMISMNQKLREQKS